jgi:hypothetical protein
MIAWITVEAGRPGRGRALAFRGGSGIWRSNRPKIRPFRCLPIPLTDGSQATTDKDCPAKTLLDRLNIPDKPVGRDQEDEPVRTPSPAAGGKQEKESNKLDGEQESSETNGEESKHVSALV